jgi:predicted ribosome quality control (RQC) complex YloA/Tae2 family protein
LESGDVESEGAKGRFTQPFSNSMDEQEAKDEKTEMVKRENEKLETTIKYVLEEEKRYHTIEENKRLPARLILSNLAADADDKAIRIFFAKYSTEM